MTTPGRLTAAEIAEQPQVWRRVSPLLETIPLQQLSLQLAIARGSDPDRPRGLNKVTETL